MRLRAAWTALAACVLAAACANDESGAPARNVLLVVLDTTRADRIGCYGGHPEATPNIDRLAAEGARFERAYSHAPWTLPSTASLLTSLHPEQHGAGGLLRLDGPAGPRPEFRPLSVDVETVTEAFYRAGWSTGAIVNVDFLAPPFGLMQGMTKVDARVPRSNRDGRSAAQTTDSALSWLSEQGDRPTFLLVHYFDPHAVYAPPAEFRARFADPRDRADDAFVFGTRDELLRLRAGQLDLDPDAIARASLLYDGEIAYADREIGRLLAGLEELGRADSTVVVFTSDHGEEFLDHGGFEHGHSMYDELIRVPLILSWPGTIEPQVFANPVRHVDVAPTLCRLAGVPVPPAFVGQDLFDNVQRPALAHGNFWGAPRTSWLSGSLKLVLEPGAPGEDGSVSPSKAMLFDLEQDPGEQLDLAAERPELVRQLRSELAAFEAALAPRGADVGTVELAEDERERLEALGYVPGPGD